VIGLGLADADGVCTYTTSCIWPRHEAFESRANGLTSWNENELHCERPFGRPG